MNINMNARRMTWVLSAVVLLLASGVVVANWQLGNILSDKITETNNLEIEARQSGDNLERAKSLEIYE